MESEEEKKGQTLQLSVRTGTLANGKITFQTTSDEQDITTNADTSVNNETKTILEENTQSDDDFVKLLYAIKDDWYRTRLVYKIDRDGNVLSKLDLDDVRCNVDKNGVPLEESKEVRQLIDRTIKQINFMDNQKKIQEEIKGYPEYNELIWQLFDYDKTLAKFKDEKNLLRSIINAKEHNKLRILFSLCAMNREDIFTDLRNNGIILDSPIGYVEPIIRRVYTIMDNYLNMYKKLPTLKMLVDTLEIPYSKEFFDEYLYNAEELEDMLTLFYNVARTSRYKTISQDLVKGTIKPDDAVEEFTKVDITYTLPTFNDTFDDLEENLNNKKQEIMISTGLKELDDKNVFLKKGKIATVFAYTGSFKTMFCTNVAYNTIKDGGNVLYISLEVSKDDMYINFLSRHSYNYDKKISHSDVKSNRLSKEDEEYLFNTIYPNFKDNLKERLIVYDETDIKSNTYSGFSKLLASANNEFQKRTGRDIDLVILDHLNLLKFGMEDKVMNDYSAINHWMSFYRKNCIDFLGQKKQIAMLCACQSSREGYKKAEANDGKYQLTGIAEGNEIERSSQIVLSIYTDDKMKKVGQAWIQVLKMRDEQIPEGDTVYLEPKYYTFGIEPKEPQSPSVSKEDDSNHVNDYSKFDD